MAAKMGPHASELRTSAETPDKYVNLHSLTILTELNSLDHGQLSRPKLEQRFDERVHDQILKPLLPVIRGLMRFMPEDRISASEALDLITSDTSEDEYSPSGEYHLNKLLTSLPLSLDERMLGRIDAASIE
jgi:hypothetical protein